MRAFLKLRPSLFGTLFLFLSIISYGCGSNQSDNVDVDPDVTGGNSDGGSTTSSGGSGSGSESGSDDSGSGTTGLTAPDVSTLPDRGKLPTAEETDGETGGSGFGSGDGIAIDPFGSVSFSDLPKIKLPEYQTIALWRGAYFDYEDNDGSCEHHQVHSIGQSFENSTDEDNKTTLNISTILENISDSPSAEKYRYKSYYTKITYNTKYLRFYEGKSSVTRDIYDNAVIEIPAEDLKETRQGLNGDRVAAFVNGLWVSYKANKNYQTTELRATLDGIDVDEEGNISLSVSADFDYMGEKNDSFTFYYTLVFFNSEYVTKAGLPDGEDETFLENSDCASFECETTYTIDFDDHTIKNAAFTGLTSWGFIDTTFNSEFEKLGAYTSLEQNHTGGKVKYRGEVYHPDCGTFSDDEQATPMSKIEAMTLVCKNEKVCRSEEEDTGWVSVDPSDLTALSYKSLELETVETNPVEEEE